MSDCVPGTHADQEWIWPQLQFKVDHMFGLGSPIAIFLATRGDIYDEAWPRYVISLSFPGGARFFMNY